MKKIQLQFVTAFVALLFLSSITSVQAQIFGVGDKDINAGLGIGSTLYSGSGYTTGVPPISASFDIGIKDDIGPGVIGVGGYIGYSSFKYEYSGFGWNYSWKYSALLIGARGTYHYELLDNIDTYGGIMIYYRNYTIKETGDNTFTGSYSSLGSGLDFAFFAGGKYYFSDNLSVFAELGYSVAWLTIGVSMRLD